MNFDLPSRKITRKRICLFKKLLFTMENATAADSRQSKNNEGQYYKDITEVGIFKR